MGLGIENIAIECYALLSQRSLLLLFSSGAAQFWLSKCHANNIKNAPAKNLVQLGIGGWQVPRQGVKVCRDRAVNILTVTDITEMGLDAAANFALERALDGTDCVYLSFDIDCIDAGFVPGTGWPEPGGLLPREALAMLGKIVQKAPICGLEVVEVSPPYDISDITSLMAARVICDTMHRCRSHSTGVTLLGALQDEVRAFLVGGATDPNA